MSKFDAPNPNDKRRSQQSSNLTPEATRHAYESEMRSQKWIAQEFGVSLRTVKRRLIQSGMLIRSGREASALTNSSPITNGLTKDFLHHHYHDLGYSLNSLAKFVGTSTDTLASRMRILGIDLLDRKKSQRRALGLPKEPQLSDDLLRHHYEIEKLSLSQIARSYRTNRKTLRSRLRTLGIQLRTYAEATLIFEDTRATNAITKEVLVREYLEKARSATDIGMQFKVSGNAVLARLDKFKIPRRTKSEATRLAKLTPQIRALSPEMLEELYVRQMHSSLKIARALGLWPSTVLDYLRHFNLKLRTRKENLELRQRNAKGGTVYLPRALPLNELTERRLHSSSLAQDNPAFIVEQRQESERLAHALLTLRRLHPDLFEVIDLEFRLGDAYRSKNAPSAAPAPTGSKDSQLLSKGLTILKQLLEDPKLTKGH